MASASWTEDQLLDGRVTIVQPAGGYRAAIDPIFLAAAVPAKSSDHVLDLGSWTGAASLCLAARVSGVHVTGLELQEGLVDLATLSARKSDLESAVTFLEGDVLKPPAALTGHQYDHVMANPPYMARGTGFPPPDPVKALAHVEGDAVLADWVDLAVNLVKPSGTVTFIHRYDRREELTDTLSRSLRTIRICPLWPKVKGDGAKRVIVQASALGDGNVSISEGLVLHQEDGGYTDEADAILRQAGALTISPLAEGQGSGLLKDHD